MSDPGDTQELLDRWQERDDRDALDQLLRTEVSILQRALRERGPGGLGASASATDIAQEAVLRLLRQDQNPTFESPRALRAYLWTSARRLLIDRL